MGSEEWRRQVRGAVVGSDGETVVAVVLAMGVPEIALQFLGDGLLVALAQHADGAVEPATELAAKLRAREWDGDRDLADQLDWALGLAHEPPLRDLNVDLDELLMLIEGNSVDGGGRVNLETGEVWHQSAIEYGVEAGELDPDEVDVADGWLYVPGSGSRAGYRDMADFVATVTDPRRAEQLERTLSGRGVFKRFASLVSRWPDEHDRWRAFSDDRQRGRARSWLASVGYRPAIRTQSPTPPSN